MTTSKIPANVATATDSQTNTALVPAAVSEAATRDAEHLCTHHLQQKAVSELLTARYGRSKKKLQAAVEYFGQVFDLCACHALERFDEAVLKMKDPLSGVSFETPTVAAHKVRAALIVSGERVVNAIIAVLDEMTVRDDASAAFTQFLAEPYQFDMENGEDNGGGAAAIEYSREVEPRLAKRFNLTVERVREIVAAADVSQDKHGHDYERLLDDIVQRLKSDDVGNCNEENKAATLAYLGYSEVIYLDPAFESFTNIARNLNGAQRLKVAAALNAEFNQQMKSYRDQLVKPYAERLAEAAEEIAKGESWSNGWTAEKLVDYRTKYNQPDPTNWHAQQCEQLEKLLNGGVIEDRTNLGFSVYQAVTDVARAAAH